MRIEILFPELCNLYGDMGNADYLRASLGDMAEFIETGLNDEPAFASSDVDMLYLGSMTERSQERVIGKLLPYKSRLEELIGRGTLILATGNAPEVFIDRIEVEDGTVIKGLGIVPYHTTRLLKARNNSLYLGRFGSDGEENIIDIVGYTSRFTYMYGVPEETYAGSDKAHGLFRNIKGTGNEPESSSEGFRLNNLIATNLLGPLLVLNPLFTRYIMSLLGAGDRKSAFWDDALKAYEVRHAEFRGDIDFGTHC